MFEVKKLELVKDTSLEYAKEYMSDRYYKLITAEKEHYKLLAFLSKQVNNSIIFDIGSYRGLSAIAMAANSSNKVISYDIGNFIEVNTPSNVEFKIGNCLEELSMSLSPLICLDVDPHDGIFELEFVEWLESHKFKGLLVLDDIFKNQAMTDFWSGIKQEKYDITAFGHHSGTGLVVF